MSDIENVVKLAREVSPEIPEFVLSFRFDHEECGEFKLLNWFNDTVLVSAPDLHALRAKLQALKDQAGPLTAPAP